MTTRPQRGGRTAGLVVAVTGASGQLGAEVCRRLLAADGVRQVIALAPARTGVPGVVWRRADPADPGLASALNRVDVLVNLELSVDPDEDRAKQRLHNTRAAQVALT